jgi:hypothetical protein
VSNELYREISTASGDTVRSSVVRTVEGTIGGTGNGVWTKGLVPFVTCVAVGGSGGSVGPSPIRIEDDRVLFGGAGTASRTVLYGERGMSFCGLRTDLLSVNESYD